MGIVADTMLWRNATRVHDWRNLEMPLTILETWISLGLVTDAEWVEEANGRARKSSIPSGKLGETIRAQPAGVDDHVSVRMGGSSPREWRLMCLIFPKTAGMSIFNLTVSYDENLHIGSEVANAFLDLYSPDTADAAFIHADPQWTRLASGPYKPPLVTTPTFAGVFWANYLGPGHLNEFSVPKLKAIETHRTEWRDDQGMFLITAATLEEALSPAGETELQRLTDSFRVAKS
jgi:hypothetical protein